MLENYGGFYCGLGCGDVKVWFWLFFFNSFIIGFVVFSVFDSYVVSSDIFKDVFDEVIVLFYSFSWLFRVGGFSVSLVLFL